MLWRAEDLYGIKLKGLDGMLGHIRDLLFDETTWTIRYLLAEEVAWPFPRTFVLLPFTVKNIEWQQRTCVVAVSRNQIEADLQLPPSDLFTPHAGVAARPSYRRGSMTGVHAGLQPGYLAAPAGAPTLQSGRNLGGFAVETRDGRPGRVTDLLIRREDWTIQDLLVNVQTPGLYRRTMVPPQQIERIDWVQGRIWLDVGPSNLAGPAAPGLTPSTTSRRTHRAS